MVDSPQRLRWRETGLWGVWFQVGLRRNRVEDMSLGVPRVFLLAFLVASCGTEAKDDAAPPRAAGTDSAASPTFQDVFDAGPQVSAPTSSGSSGEEVSSPGTSAEGMATRSTDSWESGRALDTTAAHPLPDAGAEATTEPNDSAVETLKYELARASCSYYLRCFPQVVFWYGDDEETCAKAALIAQRMAELIINVQWKYEDVWDLECLRASNVGELECPTVSGRSPVIADHTQYVAEVTEACFRFERPCDSNSDCLNGWTCSGGDQSCGRCEHVASDYCSNSADCESGEACVENACTALKVDGDTCTASDECLGAGCENQRCIQARALGDECASEEQCQFGMRCFEGKCAKPGAPNDPCDYGSPVACRAGLVCNEGTCRQAGNFNVPVGELCFGHASCVPGAKCNAGECVASTTSCNTDVHCSAGEYCDDDCHPKVAAGDECASDHFCQSEFCSDEGRCVDGSTCQ